MFERAITYFSGMCLGFLLAFVWIALAPSQWSLVTRSDSGSDVPAPALVASPRCAEDSWCWNNLTQGNHRGRLYFYQP